MIDINKQYKTRSGLPVRILATDRSSPWFPVVALVQVKGEGESVEDYTAEGRHYAGADESGFDLIEVKPRIQRAYWMNVYPAHASAGYETKSRADRYATPNRIACVEIKIDCAEGEGL